MPETLPRKQIDFVHDIILIDSTRKARETRNRALIMKKPTRLKLTRIIKCTSCVCNAKTVNSTKWSVFCVSPSMEYMQKSNEMDYHITQHSERIIIFLLAHGKWHTNIRRIALYFPVEWIEISFVILKSNDGTSNRTARPISHWRD